MVINCSTGKTLKLSEIEKYPVKVKKHSVLEIDRVEQSIKSLGLCFPITVGKVDGHNYIIDGEATYLALRQMTPKDEDPEIPIVLVRCTAETIKKMIIISASTNHCVTDISLKKFVEGTDINLKDYAFDNGELLDFYQPIDMELWEQTTGGKEVKEGIVLKSEDFVGLLA